MYLLTVFYSPRGTCSFLRKSDSRGNGSDRLIFQFVSGSKASVFVRKTLSVRLERSKNANAFFKLGGEDRRFSMKVMLEAGL